MATETPPNGLLAINLLNYPDKILIPSSPFSLKLGLLSLSPNPEKFKLAISGTGLEFRCPDNFSQYQDYAPKAQREMTVEISSQVDGQVRIDFACYQQKLVEYVVQEPRIKPATPRKQLPQLTIIPWQYVIQPATDEIIDLAQDFPPPKVPKFDEAKYQAKYADAIVITDPGRKDAALSSLIKAFGISAPNIISPILGEMSSARVVQQTLLEIVPALVSLDSKFATQLVLGVQDASLKDHLYQTIAIQIASRNPDDALATTQLLSSPVDRDNTYFQIANLLLGKDYKKASAIVEKIMNPNLRVQSLGAIAQKLIGRDLDKAYELASKIPDPAQKDSLFGIIAQQYAVKKSKRAGQVVQEISNPTVRSQVLFQIIQYLASKDLGHAADLAETHPDPEQRDKILVNICRMAMQKDPSLGKKPLEQINDFSLKLQVTLEYASALAVKHPGEVESLIKKAIDLIQKKNPPDALSLLADAISRYADDVDPAKAEQLFHNLPQQQQQQSYNQVFNHLYVLVNVTKTRLGDELAAHVFFLFNSLCSNLNDLAIQFVNDGGNASSNVLGNNPNAEIAIFNLFRQPFPLFPILERVYTELAYIQKRNFYYFLYPLKEYLSERETNVLTYAIQRFWIKQPKSSRGQLFIFNMDFIPQQKAPTIILGSDEEVNLAIQSAIKRALPGVELTIDEGLFQGGKTHDILTSLLPPPKFKIVNFVLTYDFLTNIDLFKSFILAFAK